MDNTTDWIEYFSKNFEGKVFKVYVVILATLKKAWQKLRQQFTTVFFFGYCFVLLLQFLLIAEQKRKNLCKTDLWYNSISWK
jgi:hypothetical protein